ncbi:hypothetical protein VNO77_36505 [Canavalia gladiata]|uniref:Uncharacterized protein n=1 Tax=Canavalia gladiata TaxID=3824 RepID=A0AAN9PVP6_CANGL
MYHEKIILSFFRGITLNFIIVPGGYWHVGVRFKLITKYFVGDESSHKHFPAAISGQTSIFLLKIDRDSLTLVSLAYFFGLVVDVESTEVKSKTARRTVLTNGVSVLLALDSFDNAKLQGQTQSKEAGSLEYVNKNHRP